MNSSINVIILGCGISGLSCGIRLLKAGFDVEIMAHRLPPHTTSNIAAAFWLPFHVHPLERALEWAAVTYQAFAELMQDANSGVSFRPFIDLHSTIQLNPPAWTAAAPNWRRAQTDELPTGCADGFSAEVPLSQSNIYLPYLIDRFQQQGGTITKLAAPLTSLDEIATPETLTINCTGLGAGALCNDEKVLPIRGQVIRMTNPGLTRIWTYESADELAYVIPRDEDVIVGGTIEEGDWSEEVRAESAEKILTLCTKLEPALADATILEHRVGLRPGRTAIRLEAETLPNGATVIHNYGHGGGGYALSWGCADEVVKLSLKENSFF